MGSDFDIKQVLDLISQDDFFGQDPATIAAYRGKRRKLQEGLLDSVTQSLAPRQAQASSASAPSMGRGSLGTPGPRASAEEFMNSISGDAQRRQREMGDFRNTRAMNQQNLADNRTDAGLRLEMERQNEKKRLADRANLLRLIGGGGQKTMSSQESSMRENIVPHYGRVFRTPTRSESSSSQQSYDPQELINLILSSL